MQRDELTWIIGELKGLSSELGSLAGHGAEPLLLALDQGGHASRAIVFDPSGREVAQAFAPISTYRSGKDRVEHAAEEVLESLQLAITDVCQSLGADVGRIVAAGLATQRSSIVCWDKRTGEPLSPILSWQDRRHAAWLQRWRERENDIRRITGLPLSAHYGVSKFRWCLDELPAVREAAQRGSLAIGPLASWLLFRLAAEQPFVIDPANASRTLLWDLSLQDWSPELLALAGIPVHLLPESVPSRHAYGTLQLPGISVPLTVTSGDQSTVPFAHGLPDGHTIYLNLGTGAFLQCPLRHDPGATALLRSVLWQDTDGVRYSLEGTVNGAGSALDWLDGETGLDDHRAAKSLTRAKVEGLGIPVFLNGISGVGSPFWITHLDSRFLDPVGADDELLKVAGVVESIAFLIAANVAEMRSVQPGLNRMVAGGGLSQSDYLLECIASLTGVTVERSTLREATATGLAFLLGGAHGIWSPASETALFPPREDAGLKQRQRRWQQAMSAASGTHPKHS